MSDHGTSMRRLPSGAYRLAEGVDQRRVNDLVTALAAVIAADEAAGQGHPDWDALPASSRASRTRYWKALAHKIADSGLVRPVEELPDPLPVEPGSVVRKGAITAVLAGESADYTEGWFRVDQLGNPGWVMAAELTGATVLFNAGADQRADELYQVDYTMAGATLVTPTPKEPTP